MRYATLNYLKAFAVLFVSNKYPNYYSPTTDFACWAAHSSRSVSHLDCNSFVLRSESSSKEVKQFS